MSNKISPATLVTVLLIVMLIAGVTVWARRTLELPTSLTNLQADLNTGLQDTVTQSVVEIAFRELTIPYLRSRSYESALGAREQLSRTSQFTSYLTSYTSDGLQINGLLTIPNVTPPAGGWPAIVFVHGYIPPAQYRTEEKYVEYVNALARSGMVVFKIDLRGHGDSEGAPSGSYYASGYVIDTLNAVAALQSTDFVNPQAIGLWGHSMAGNIVLRSMAVKPEIPAAVIWAGAGFSYQDLAAYGLNDNSYRRPPQTSTPSSQRQRLFEAHGQFDPTSAFWQQVAPTNYLSELQGAIQLHHAIDDTVVRVNYSRDLAQLLETNQVEHELYEYNSGGHNISGSAFSQAMQRTVTFYKQHLEE